MKKEGKSPISLGGGWGQRGGSEGSPDVIGISPRLGAEYGRDIIAE